MLWEKELTVWEVLGIGCRDLVVIMGTIVLISAGRWGAFEQMAPTWLGKLTTAGQFAFFSVLFIDPEYMRWAFYLVAVLSCCAGAQYLWQFVVSQFLRASPPDAGAESNHQVVDGN
jgi:phosphatidylglycerophosphate synthase